MPKEIINESLDDNDRENLKTAFDKKRAEYKALIESYKKSKDEAKKKYGINNNNDYKQEVIEVINSYKNAMKKYLIKENLKSDSKSVDDIEKEFDAKQFNNLAQVRNFLASRLKKIPTETKDTKFKDCTNKIVKIVNEHKASKIKNEEYENEKLKLLKEKGSKNAIVAAIRQQDDYLKKLITAVKELKVYVKHISTDRPAFDASINPLKHAIKSEAGLQNTKTDTQYHLAHRLSISNIINTLKDSSTLECVDMIISILVPVRQYGDLQAGHTSFLDKFFTLKTPKDKLKRLNSSPFNLRAGDPDLNSSIQENIDINVDNKKPNLERRATLTSEQFAELFKDIELKPRTSTNVSKIDLDKIESLVSKAPIFKLTKQEENAKKARKRQKDLQVKHAKKAAEEEEVADIEMSPAAEEVVADIEMSPAAEEEEVADIEMSPAAEEEVVADIEMSPAAEEEVVADIEMSSRAKRRAPEQASASTTKPIDKKFRVRK